MDKIKYFQYKILEICQKTKTAIPLITQDNRLGKHYVASVFEGTEVKKKYKFYFLRYNEKLIRKINKSDIIHIICHELGHIRTDAKKESEREYKAEKFALKVIKKYFPRNYNRAIEYIKHARYFRSGIYVKAFTKLLKEVK